MQRIRQLDQGYLAAFAGVDKGVELKSEDAIVITLRPMTVSQVVPFNAFPLRGKDGPLVKWEPNRCVVGADCMTVFGSSSA